MELRDRIKFHLRQSYGDFNTILENQYNNLLTEHLLNNDKNGREVWLTYNQVILELKHSLKNVLKVQELQYRLTDGEYSKDSVIKIIEEVKTTSPELNRLYYKIKNFKFE